MYPSRRLVRCSLIAALGLLGGCGDPGPATQPAMPPLEVGTITVSTRELTLQAELPGRTIASLVAEVRPQINGIVRERLFEEGVTVKAGQPLYQIDPDSYEAAVASAEAALIRAEAAATTAKLRAERLAALAGRQLVSRQDLDDAEAAQRQSGAAVAEQRAQLQGARIDLRRTRIAAPITGRIGRSEMTAGALVSAGQAQALATVQQLDPMFVDIPRSSQELLQLREQLASGRLQRATDDSARVTLLLEDGSRYELPGKLAFTDVTIDPGTASVMLRAVFPNPEQRLLPGMYVRAVLSEGERHDAIVLPQSVVQRDHTGAASVFVVGSDRTATVRAVTIGRSIDGNWLIESGLQPGERVIADNLQKIRAGSRVNAVVRAEASSAATTGAAH
ncbi:MAG: efflux RND transporter periplasmic adaptor subunit [Pseudomonadales bacterium]|jgi:membrane fusion protein (multidrug efflux system)|nr:efflux RND transporter periplasmic adaptor subunit [Pseudomonadales bacterium]